MTQADTLAYIHEFGLGVRREMEGIERFMWVISCTQVLLLKREQHMGDFN